MRIDKMGIWFIHAKKHPVHEDEVCLLWWWAREEKKKILSIGFNSCFKSFRELDECWEGYYKACKES